MNRQTLVTLSFIALISVVPVQADMIKIVADPWMPYNGDGKSTTGYIIDMATEIFKKAGHTVVFEVVPWARALEDVRAGTFQGAAGCQVGDAGDFVYPQVEQGSAAMEYVVRKGSAWRYSGIGSLGNIKLSVIKEYSYYTEVDDYISENQTNRDRIDFGFGVDPLSSSLRKLAEGKVDAVVGNGYVLRYQIGRMGLQDKIVSAGVGAPPEPIYIGFSPNNPKSTEYARLLSEGTEQLRKSGRLAQILARYGLTDWK